MRSTTSISTINEREIVALVGESGSGKSTVARLLAQVYKPTAGEIFYQGRPLARCVARQAEPGLPQRRADGVPGPVQLAEPGLPRLARHPARPQAAPPRPRPPRRAASRGRAGRRGGRAAPRPPRSSSAIPYELSGGQRQRIGFAQALAYRPKLILADEPVSMLDVSIRVGLLNLMAELRATRASRSCTSRTTSPARSYVADRLIVMYAGHIVESGPTEDVLTDPKHPVHRSAAVGGTRPSRAAGGRRRHSDKGEPPRVIDPPPGCRFRWRCPLAIEECHQVTPKLRVLAPDHSAACHVATASVTSDVPDASVEESRQ